MAEELTLQMALAQLEEAAPGAPFLALGQTVFWDEPMKGGILLASQRLGYKRELVAGVHDTDYFAKLPTGRRQAGKFKALPHNDTTTKALWSAAGEFSALFGSETVVTRDVLYAAGLKIGKITRERPNILDEATEAWDWRGIVSLEDKQQVAAEVPLKVLFRELYATLEWALEQTLDCLTGEDRTAAEGLAQRLRALTCDAGDRSSTLGELFKSLIADIYDFCANRPVGIHSTSTTELLKFNRDTAFRPRFSILQMFIELGDTARAAYDEAIKGSEIYPLARFGSGAIPFDLVIPGQGRGTIRLAPKGIVIMTPQPHFITLKNPVANASELAEAIESKLGKDCVLVGKAVTLIGMLASEFVFIFHEGASPYVKYSRKLHDLLQGLGGDLRLHPLLRVKYSPWDELDTCCAWLKLPEPFRQAFGADDICAPSFAARWRQVAAEQNALLARLGELRRPIDLIRHLAQTVGGSWAALAEEYERHHDALETLKDKVAELRALRCKAYDTMRGLRRERVGAERASGDHFRERIFEKDPSPTDIKRREELTAAASHAAEQLREANQAIRDLMGQQNEIARSPEILEVHERRRQIEIEAELKRLSMIRTATIAGKGLMRASNRPSAWWFPLVSPDGLWFRSTVENAEYRLEPLSTPPLPLPRRESHKEGSSQGASSWRGGRG